MKKVFSFLISFIVVSSFAELSASAETIIAVKKDDTSAWVTGWCYITSEKIADFNPSQEIFEFGDIIQFENIRTEVSEVGYSRFDSDLPWEDPTIRTDDYWLFVRNEDQPYSVTKVGSIFDNPETAQFTVLEKRDRDKLILADDEGNQYNYNIDWLNHGYYQPDCIDLTSLHSGDVISCITYNDSPMLAKEIISSAPPSGDANGDGTLDILDVIIVNQAILGKTTLIQSDKIYHVDFNQNGVPDATDSLTILKKIVSLE